MKKFALIFISILVLASCSKGQEKAEIQNGTNDVSQEKSQEVAEKNKVAENDETRTADVRDMGLALGVYFEDQDSDSFVSGLNETPTFIGTGAGETDLCGALVPTYIADLPVDPTYERSTYESCESYHLGYAVKYDPAEKEVVFSAPFAQGEENIEYGVKTEYSEQLALVSRGIQVEDEVLEEENVLEEKTNDGYLSGIFNASERAHDGQRLSAINNLNGVLGVAIFEDLDYPETGCVNRDTWKDYLPSLGGSVAVAFEGQEVSYQIDSDVPEICKNGEFWFQKNPGETGQYAYGLYTYLAGTNNANAVCSNLVSDGSNLGNDVVEGDACYVILGN